MTVVDQQNRINLGYKTRSIGWRRISLIGMNNISARKYTMRKTWVSTCLTVFLLAGLVNAEDQIQTNEASIAKEKAKLLEEKFSADNDEALPRQSETITKRQAQSVDPSGKAALGNAITCLARSIYWEANRTNIGEMEAVANVVMNRLGHEGFPDTICDVVKQGREQGLCQFSWWCDGRSDEAQEEKAYSRAKEIARRALNQQLKDSTDGAMYFHNRKIIPNWSNEYIKTVEIGDHLFYKPTDGKAK